MSRRAVDPRVIALGVGVPLVILLVVVVLSIRDDGGDDGRAGRDPRSSVSSQPDGTGPAPAIDERWNDDLAAAVTPLTTVLADLASTVDAWATGAVSDDELDALLARVDGVVRAVQRDVALLDAHPEDPLARPMIVGMADLYVGAVDAHRFALDSPGGLRTQYDYLGRRLRILADRLFDRARERTDVAVDPGPGVSVVLPAEVPDWERLEIAAGPPLVDVDSNRTDALPLTREDDRPSQPEGDWSGDVEAIDAPTVDDVRAVVGDVDALGRLADRLVAGAEALREVPVPDGDRGRADRVALGWLVRADAARAAQLRALDARPAVGRDRLVAMLLELSATVALAPR